MSAAPAVLRCGGVTADGEPCSAPPELVLPSGFCYSHDATREQERLYARQRGGLATATRHRRQAGLDPGELGPLESEADVKRRQGIVSEAVATGRLTPTAASAIIRSDQLWLAAESQHLQKTELRELADAVRALATRPPAIVPTSRSA